MPHTNMSMYKQQGLGWGGTRWRRVPALTLPMELGAGTPAQCPGLGGPEPSLWGHKYFGFVQKHQH